MGIRSVGTVVLFAGALFAAAANTASADESSVYAVQPKDRICFTLYTIHAETLKLTAQFYPLDNTEPFEATLEVKRGDAWETVDTADIAYPGYTATFRVEDWDDSQSHAYRVVHNDTAFYEGVATKNPIDRDEFVMAAMSCNSVATAHGGDNSRSDIVANLQKVKPDLIFFAGDQVYDHSRHLLFWLRFGREFGELTRSTPTVCLPDDHDIGQGNLWGDGGKRCPTRDGVEGGYYMPVEYVQEVERAQTSHLPDPFDPTPVDRGIGVYYTHLNWGGVSFAVLEDRKFKSGPARFNRGSERADSITTPGVDRRKFDAPDATLLGERQLEFLEHWVTDWTDAEMKCVLSQTVFAQTCNYSGQHERELLADFDSNGWPQSGRDRALRVIRKGFACMVAGDQHLGSVVQHGIDDWGDAGFSFASPAIANFWLRWWDPSEPGRNRAPDSPPYTGEYLDGFGNKMTIRAVANPSVDQQQADGRELSTRAAGIGIVRFNKPLRTIRFECWPRNVDVTGPDSAQYDGWPVTVSQVSNNAMPGKPRLPTLRLQESNQVVTVRDSQSGEVVSSLRVVGRSYQPATPEPGNYDVAIGEGDGRRWLRGLPSRLDNQAVRDASPHSATTPRAR